MNKKEALTQLEIMATNATGRLGEAKSEEEKALLNKHIEALDMGITAINLRNSLILISSGTVVELKTGHWIEDDEQTHVEKTYHCSECGCGIWGVDEKSNYCPNCGAKMERSKE